MSQVEGDARNNATLAKDVGDTVRARGREAHERLSGERAGMVTSRSIKVGDVLDNRYELVSRVGGGGMGDVWECTDTLLRRKVAVKILLADLSDDRGFQERFRREARAIAALNGPGIVDVYDYGELTSDDGRLAYLVMEFIEGNPLSRMLGLWGRLPYEDTMHIMGGVARALAEAHDNGIVHRDIKPGNILVRQGGDVCLVDFGIARDDTNHTMTTTGVVLGTVTYMSPEQAAGENLTPASDIYSLGVVAHQCLSGSPPFKADTPLGVLSAHLRNPPPPLPIDIPESVEGVIRTCLQKERHRRWSSAAELAAACQHALEGSTRGSTSSLGSVPNNAGDMEWAPPSPQSAAHRSAPHGAARSDVHGIDPVNNVDRSLPDRSPTTPISSGWPLPEPNSGQYGGSTVYETTSARAAVPVTPPPSGEFNGRRRRRGLWWLFFVGVITMFFTAGAIAAATTWEPSNFLSSEPSPSMEVPGSPVDSEKQGNDDDHGHASLPLGDADDESSPSADTSPSDDQPDEDEPSDDEESPSASPSESESPTPQETQVPNVIDESRQQAEQLISDQGLNPESDIQGDGDHQCPVEAQQPSAGTTVEEGSTVTITLRAVADESECSDDSGGEQ